MSGVCSVLTGSYRLVATRSAWRGVEVGLGDAVLLLKKLSIC